MDDSSLARTGPAGWRSSARMPFATEGIQEQRQLVYRDFLQHEIASDTAYDASLVLAELVTNAVQHGEPLDGDLLDLCWGTWSGQVHVEVTDRGAATVPIAAPAPVVALHGRGLAIVAALATSWGVRSEPASLTVWAALPARRSAV